MEKPGIKLTISTKEEDILSLFTELPLETKQRLLELYTFDDILGVAEKQLKGDTDLWAWDTSGWRHGANLREAIAKIQGLEPELREDHKSAVRALTSERDSLKKYRDLYYKIYHLPDDVGYDFLKKNVGLI